jgi:NTP pyrophosphatase (non-canonical NTP hydrolase)
VEEAMTKLTKRQEEVLRELAGSGACAWCWYNKWYLRGCGGVTPQINALLRRMLVRMRCNRLDADNAVITPAGRAWIAERDAERPKRWRAVPGRPECRLSSGITREETEDNAKAGAKERAAMTETFGGLRKQNVDRCNQSYHPLDAWSLTDWACAAAGEMGEACNIVKKLRRLDDEHSRTVELRPDLYIALADEIADAVIYLDLLAARAGIDLGDAIIHKFNQTSEKIGSKVKLPY